MGLGRRAISLAIGIVFLGAVEAGAKKSVQLVQEPWSGGLYISDFDVPHLSVLEAQIYYDQLPTDALIVNVIEGAERELILDVWEAPDRFNLTYCVSSDFGKDKDRVIQAMALAISDWSSSANVRFYHLADQDDHCDENNQNVVFDVRPVYRGLYLARAFFPSTPRAQRNLLIDGSAFAFKDLGFAGILRHELGHVLGFRHEHIHADNRSFCSEGGSYEPITQYDRKSVMHYPQCGGENSFEDLSMSEYDHEGARKAYP